MKINFGSYEFVTVYQRIAFSISCFVSVYN